MVQIDTEQPKYFIKFKPKDKRPNKMDDKFELFRHAIGLHDTRDILDLYHYQGNHMKDPIEKHLETVTDINSFGLPIVIARLTIEQVSRLRRDPNVEYVAPDGVSYATVEPGPTQGKQTIPWGYTKVRAKQAWDITGKKGDGVVVAVIDTGADSNHPDITPGISVNQNFTVEPGFLMRDGSHHGMHVAGTIVMQDNTQGFVGIAPKCKVWNLKAGYSRTNPPENGPGLFDWSDWLEALEYAKVNNAPIVNNSIASNNRSTEPGPSTIATSVRDGFDNKGIIYIGALGNDAVQAADYFMSNTYGVFGISSFQQDNAPSTFSNLGVHVDFALPGTDIWSTIGNGAYFSLSGTSMASPCASGICALALSVFNDKGCPPYGTGLKKNKVVGGAMRMAVDKLGKFTTERDNRYGFGLPLADKVCRAMMGLTLS